MQRHLSPQQLALVEEAQRRGLSGSESAPGYLSPGLCTLLSLLLAVPTLGYSLVFVPILWVVQYERTDHRLRLLRRQLEQSGPTSVGGRSAGLEPGDSAPAPPVMPA
jgi:hypothetical protein